MKRARRQKPKTRYVCREELARSLAEYEELRHMLEHGYYTPERVAELEKRAGTRTLHAGGGDLAREICPLANPTRRMYRWQNSDGRH